MRIFTPEQELPTAGHPSIGTAYYLAQNIDQEDGLKTLTLAQKVGDIKVEVEMKNGSPIKATMYPPLPEFPTCPLDTSTIARLLSLSEDDILESGPEVISCGVRYLLVPVKSIDRVRNIKFRLDVWDEVKDRLNCFVYPFTLETDLPESNVHGRMFAPEAGILEDPATGSANGPLACYLNKHNLAVGPLISEQGFELGRPSILHIEAKGTGENITEVKVGGTSILVGSGKLFLD